VEGRPLEVQRLARLAGPEFALGFGKRDGGWVGWGVEMRPETRAETTRPPQPPPLDPPVHSARKFSAVLGTTSARRLISMRPTGSPSAVMSKKTLGLDAAGTGVGWGCGRGVRPPPWGSSAGDAPLPPSFPPTTPPFSLTGRVDRERAARARRGRTPQRRDPAGWRRRARAHRGPAGRGHRGRGRACGGARDKGGGLREGGGRGCGRRRECRRRGGPCRPADHHVRSAGRPSCKWGGVGVGRREGEAARGSGG